VTTPVAIGAPASSGSWLPLLLLWRGWRLDGVDDRRGIILWREIGLSAPRPFTAPRGVPGDTSLFFKFLVICLIRDDREDLMQFLKGLGGASRAFAEEGTCTEALNGTVNGRVLGDLRVSV
jgi:hypothetical protein